MAKKLTKYQVRMFKMLIGSIIYFMIMVFGSIAGGLLVGENPDVPAFIFLSFTFLFVAFLYFYKIMVGKRRKFDIIRHSISISIYLVLTVLAFFIEKGTTFISLIGILYAGALVSDRTFSIIKKRRARNIILAVIFYIFATLIVLISLAVMGEEEMGTSILAINPLSLVVTSFVGVMRLIFSGLRGKTLVEIIRKTYTIEILYGLVTLIFATSIMFLLIEDGFNNYGDALWYCFAVVTTIGFGDFAATTVIGRILTVILGIYGIIVVALITSIIVNFYNETAHLNKEGDEEIKKEVQELDKSRKTYVEDNEDDELLK